MGILHQQIIESLTNHTPTAEQIKDIEDLRVAGKAVGFYLDKVCPPSRERSLAVTKLEECIMWAVKSIVLPREDFAVGGTIEAKNAPVVGEGIRVAVQVGEGEEVTFRTSKSEADMTPEERMSAAIESGELL